MNEKPQYVTTCMHKVNKLVTLMENGFFKH